MMRQIDIAVTMSVVLVLFFFVSAIYMLGLQGYAVICLLLPVITGTIGWKITYFIYTMIDKPKVIN